MDWIWLSAEFIKRLFLTVIKMLSEWWNSIVSTFDRLIPRPPAELVGACGDLQVHARKMSWVGHFVPTSAIAIAAGALLAVAVAVLALRIVRIGVSVKTGGGGA